LSVPVKLILTWDITPDKEQEYFEFVIREFIPGVQRLGFDLSEAWATVYGERPQIQVDASLPSLAKARQITHSAEWDKLNEQLMDFVQNYSMKIVQARGGFQF
jgi:hypothetical protein